MHNSRLKGLLSEKRFIIAALELGWKVALPIDVGAKYDVIVNRGERWETVQVKTAAIGATGTLAIDIRRAKNTKAYEKGDFDLIAAVDWPNAIFLVPFLQLKSSTRLSLANEKEILKYRIWAGQK